MAKNMREDRFTWGKGDVEIIMPNGKKLQPKKKSTDTSKKKTTVKRGK